MGFPGGRVVKNLSDSVQEVRVDCWVRKISWSRMGTHSSVFLPGKFLDRGGRQSMGSKIVRCDWACMHIDSIIDPSGLLSFFFLLMLENQSLKFTSCEPTINPNPKFSLFLHDLAMWPQMCSVILRVVNNKTAFKEKFPDGYWWRPSYNYSKNYTAGPVTSLITDRLRPAQKQLA